MIHAADKSCDLDMIKAPSSSGGAFLFREIIISNKIKSKKCANLLDFSEKGVEKKDYGVAL